MLGELGPDQRKAFETQLAGRNLEQALSRLRRIAKLLTGSQTLDGLTATAATELDIAVCRAIVGQLDVARADMEAVYRFAAWAARAAYRTPLELFTVNYDLLIEAALE